VNMGQKILVRLRPPYSPDSFMPEEDIIQTMLHELTHNVHGPHDEKFYKFLSGLQEEYDALQRSGYAGEGFFSPGHKLGVSHNLPPHLARTQALAAAEKRRQISQTLGGGGKRLGGDINSDSALSPRERAARAAERRIRDEKSCGQGDMAQREADKAAKESIENKVIDLTLDDSDNESEVIIVDNDAPVPGPSKIAVQLPKSALPSSLPHRPKPSTSAKRDVSNNLPPPINMATKPLREEWQCSTCTLINPALSLQCEACLTTKPISTQAGWTCLVCAESGMPHEFWTCSFCGTVKSQS